MSLDTNSTSTGHAGCGLCSSGTSTSIEQHCNLLFGGERGLLTFTNIGSSRQGYLLEMVDKLMVKTIVGLRQEVYIDVKNKVLINSIYFSKS